MKFINELLDIEILENNEHEFKIKLDDEIDEIEEWAKTLVGFANVNGGYLLVGVTDDGIAIGLSRKEIDETKNLVLLSIDKYIFPHIQVKFDLFECENDRFVLSIFVKYVNKIIIYKTDDFNEKVYIRNNGVTIPASINQIIEMSKRKIDVDEFILDKMYLKKDFTSFNKLAKLYREDNKEPNRELLISREVIFKDGRITKGLNMFSDNYNENDTLVCCRLWKGYDKGSNELLDKKEFNGNLCKIYENVIKFVKRNTRSGFVKSKNGRRINTYSYPNEALSEAIVNALAHRDYSMSGAQIDIDIFKNRLVIASPGSWILIKNPDEYDLDCIPSVRRNNIISNCFEILGLMEKSGSGFKKINEVYEKFNIKKPSLRNANRFFFITFYDLLNDDSLENINVPYMDDILKFCEANAKSRQEIQELLGLKNSSYFSNKILSPLVKNNLIKPIGKKHSRNVKYIKNDEE